MIGKGGGQPMKTLLEWLNARRSLYLSLESVGDTYLHGKVDAYEEIIDFVKTLQENEKYVLQKYDGITSYFKVISKEDGSLVIGEKPECTYRELTQAEINFLDSIEIEEDEK